MSRVRGPYARFCERDEAVTPHPTRYGGICRVSDCGLNDQASFANYALTPLSTRLTLPTMMMNHGPLMSLDLT